MQHPLPPRDAHLRDVIPRGDAGQSWSFDIAGWVGGSKFFLLQKLLRICSLCQTTFAVLNDRPKALPQIEAKISTKICNCQRDFLLQSEKISSALKDSSFDLRIHHIQCARFRLSHRFHHPQRPARKGLLSTISPPHSHMALSKAFFSTAD